MRTFSVGSEAEGCVADDDTGALYISEENDALWRYSAEPGGGTTRTAVDVLDLRRWSPRSTTSRASRSSTRPTARASSSSPPRARLTRTTSYFSVYRREGANDFVKTFRVSDGASSDDCDHTDGSPPPTADLGPAFPRGMFVCQDNNNDAPGAVGHQDLKMVRLEKVVNLDGGEEPPPPPPPPPPSSDLVGGTGDAQRQQHRVHGPGARRPCRPTTSPAAVRLRTAATAR